MAGQNSDDHKKVMELIKDLKIAMLSTRGPDGKTRSRPMAVSDTAFDGTLYFLTGEASGKVHDLENDSETVVTFADAGKNSYVALRGEASVSTDPVDVKKHWTEVARAWFPKGSDDPNVSVISVKIDEAQYWDQPNGKMVVAYGYVKALLTGEPVRAGEHGSVKL